MYKPKKVNSNRNFVLFMNDSSMNIMFFLKVLSWNYMLKTNKEYYDLLTLDKNLCTYYILIINCYKVWCKIERSDINTFLICPCFRMIQKLITEYFIILLIHENFDKFITKHLIYIEDLV